MRRLRSASRILAVQKQLQRLEERKLADIQSQGMLLKAEEAEILCSLNETDALHGLFVEAMAKRLRGLAEQGARLDTDRAAVMRRLLEQARRRKRAETLHRAVSDAWRREADRRELLDMIERAAGSPDASLP